MDATKANMEITACVMNVISYEKAYCLFPRATLENRVTTVFSDIKITDGIVDCMRKYSRRGWTFHEGSTLRHSDRAFAATGRMIDDSLSWVIPLDTTGLSPSKSFPAHSKSRLTQLAHDPVAVCSWRWGSIGTRLDFRVLKMSNLQYAYALNHAHHQYLALTFKTSSNGNAHSVENIQ